MTETPNRWRRFADWDERPLRLDKFAAEDWQNGFSAFSSPADPKPGVSISGGRVISMDGVLDHDFDMIDGFIAHYHLDPDTTEACMAMDSNLIASMLVDMHVPRETLVKIAHGLTPAKLADVVSRLNALEIAFAYSKMRARKTPGNQGHVTNAKDDPLQLAADAATAVALGFDEVETTMRVARNAWSNAVACAVGASVGAGARCSSVRVKKQRNCRSAWRASPPMLKPCRFMAQRKPSWMAMIRRGPRPSCRCLCVARHQDALHQWSRV